MDVGGGRGAVSPKTFPSGLEINICVGTYTEFGVSFISENRYSFTKSSMLWK